LKDAGVGECSFPVSFNLGLSEPTIGALVGHKGHSITSRYMHLADAVLLAAADEVAGQTIVLMQGTK
jgi:hypothetical protein